MTTPTSFYHQRRIKVMPLAKLEAIKRFFNTEGYPPLENRELLDLRRDEPAYTEVALLCAEALGETISQPQEEKPIVER
jgi:hypothetical protein